MVDDPEPETASGTLESNRRALRPSRKRHSRGQPLRIGRVLGTSFSIWVRHCPVFLLLSGLVFVPYALYLAWLSEAPAEETKLLGHFNDVFARFSQMIVAAPVISTVISELKGRRDSFGMAFSRGMQSFPSVIGVGLATAILLVICAAPMATAAILGSEAGAMALALPTLAVVLLLSLMLFVAIPVAVVERPGVLASLKRSVRLTSGRKFSIFVIMVIFATLSFVLVMVLVGLILQSGARGDRWFDGKGVWLIMAGIAAFLASIEAVVVAVVYHDLRVAVDGVDTSEIAEVFD